MSFETTPVLPSPELTRGRFAYASMNLGEVVVPEGSITAYTDEALFQATGVRMAFTTREGGLSTGPYEALNLGVHVDDDIQTVVRNRSIVCGALAGTNHVALIVPKQVHGNHVVHVRRNSPVVQKLWEAEDGCDAVTVAHPATAALLCFADCVPVIAVLPTGAFAVIHAGWRGVANHIAVKALTNLAILEAAEYQLQAQDLIAGANIYLGPYIHAECFETGPETHDELTRTCGDACIHDESHIDLGIALRTQLGEAGVVAERIADLDACTVCNNQEFFSYRAQDGVCGRHGAFAVRMD